MNFFLHRSPFWLQWLLSDYTWRINTPEKVIYLTFDDGPIPQVTEEVIKTLDAYQAKATFFCIGDNIRKHPTIFQELKKQGHSIGNHTFNHLNGWKTDTETYIDNFYRCQDIMETETNLFRPPYGRIRKAQFERLPSNTRVIMWDVLTGDFSPKIKPDKALGKSKLLCRPGTILLLHDSIKAHKSMSYILPGLLDYFSERAYRFEGLPML